MQNNKIKNTILILAGLGFADLLGAIDSTGLSVVLPKLTNDLHISVFVSQWIPNIYVLSMVSLLLISGKIADKYGPKKIYISGLILFGLSSLLLGFVEHPYLMIFLRAIQGIGTAILYTAPMSIIAQIWDEPEKAFAVTASFFGIGMILGPVVGGLFGGLNFGSYFGWHLLFLINVPVVLAAIWIVVKNIPEIKAQNLVTVRPRFAILLALLFGLLALSFSNIPRYFSIIATALLAILFYVDYRKTAQNRFIGYEIFRSKDFVLGNIISFFEMVILMSLSYLLVFYFEKNIGWSTQQAGLAILPVPLFTIIFSVVGGNMKNRRLGALLSNLLIFCGIVLLLFSIGRFGYYSLPVVGVMLLGSGSGLLMTSIFALIMSSAPNQKSGEASGILNTFQQMGSLIGVAMIIPLLEKVNLSIMITAIISLVSLALSVWLYLGYNKQINRAGAL